MLDGTQSIHPLTTEGSNKLTPAPETKNVRDVASEAPSDDASVDRTAIDLVLASLDDSKAEEIVSIDLKGKSALADHMVIASGRSHRHVSAVADHLLRDLKEQGFGPAKVEGLTNGDWVLIDTGDIIIHIFRPEVRSFYNIEKMWSASDQDPKLH
ncbi:ribosome silencing factor [Aureimonas frigidaquae]|uniref:ribosome silencing factor n=1 Tax=Aureimonas frigidaquae TaxID=424757 RepID=UPI0009FA34AF|nr:ribosome silencing factor [Aureimonas frigidaquae]